MRWLLIIINYDKIMAPLSCKVLPGTLQYMVDKIEVIVPGDQRRLCHIKVGMWQS